MFTALTTYTVDPVVVSLMRVLAGILLSWMLSMAFGRLFIHRMRKLGNGQPYNPDGPQSHLAKAGTPTAGGIFFISGLSITVLLLGRVSQPYTFIPLVAMWGFFLIGLIDDLLKLQKNESVGLRTPRKLAMQILMGAFILWLFSQGSGLASSVVTLPWNPKISINIGMWYPLTALVYLVYFANAVNITDGLDGLAVGIAIPVLLVMLTIAALFGFGFHSQYIQNTISRGSMDLALVIGATLGSLLAFLWYNGLKAQVIMGDCGSHAIGALIAVSALLMKIELVVLVASGMFFIECVSSLVQIISIRIFHKKIFLMAPIHHHFEKRGFEESKIVTRFYIGSMLCAVLAGLLFMVKYL
jgi:phospho-N-acetylmuramoyl-pentapeptide-transferase